MVALASHLDTAPETQLTPIIRLSHLHLSLRKITKNNSCLLTLSARGVWGFNSDVRCEKWAKQHDHQ